MPKEINYKDYTIKIQYDISPWNPREEDSNIGIMACSHRRYNIGDKDHIVCFNDHKNWSEVKKWLYKNGAIAVLPIFLYDHSGITINTTGFSCPWDSGQIGFIYTTKEKLRYIGFSWKTVTKKRLKKIKQWLKDEVERYDEYLTGNVHGYTVLSPGGEKIKECWGFYGSDHETSGLLESARNSIDNDLLHKENSHKKSRVCHGIISNGCDHHIACHSGMGGASGWEHTFDSKNVTCKRCLRVMKKGIQQSLNLEAYNGRSKN